MPQGQTWPLLKGSVGPCTPRRAGGERASTEGSTPESLSAQLPKDSSKAPQPAAPASMNRVPGSGTQPDQRGKRDSWARAGSGDEGSQSLQSLL